VPLVRKPYEFRHCQRSIKVDRRRGDRCIRGMVPSSLVHNRSDSTLPKLILQILLMSS
jgi:hypothetical protein